MTAEAPILPYLTSHVPAVGGWIKQHLEDFQVREIPLYEASGQGTHVYFQVRKAGVPTSAAVDRIARYMGVRSMDIGVAGLKDARAVTTQIMSLEHADEEKLARYKDPQVQVVAVSRHTNKLRSGHLAGNEFIIKIRGVDQQQLGQAQAVLDVLVARGVPNFFGVQRFGARGDTAELGRALIGGATEEFLAMFLGRSRSDDPPDCRAARDAFDAGFLDRALKRWPRHYVNERRVIMAMKRSRHPQRALAALDGRMKRLYVSAFQSMIFNEVLSQRLEQVDSVLAGDLAQKTDTGGVFMVADEAAEQERARRFEISATGPIVGYRTHFAEGRPGQIELETLARQGVRPEDFRHVGHLKIKGARRPLRFQLLQPGLAAGQDEHGPFLELRFTAASGCYATVVTGEITKNPQQDQAQEEPQIPEPQE